MLRGSCRSSSSRTCACLRQYDWALALRTSRMRGCGRTGHFFSPHTCLSGTGTLTPLTHRISLLLRRLFLLGLSAAVHDGTCNADQYFTAPQLSPCSLSLDCSDRKETRSRRQSERNIDHPGWPPLATAFTPWPLLYGCASSCSCALTQPDRFCGHRSGRRTRWWSTSNTESSGLSSCVSAGRRTAVTPPLNLPPPPFRFFQDGQRHRASAVAAC